MTSCNYNNFDERGKKVRFEDQGITGAAVGNRPGVLKFQEAPFAGLVCTLVVDWSAGNLQATPRVSGYLVARNWLAGTLKNRAVICRPQANHLIVGS
ncbi:MAG TPA: hypothetical protein VFB45_01645, partial [Pseudolabrys sp.]|nr:hypothetical protein [Pseudolabrys sp.]